MYSQVKIKYPTKPLTRQSIQLYFKMFNLTRVARFSTIQHSKSRKIYKMATKMSNALKIDRMAIYVIYQHIFHWKTLKIYQNFDFWFENIPFATLNLTNQRMCYLHGKNISKVHKSVRMFFFTKNYSNELLSNEYAINVWTKNWKRLHLKRALLIEKRSVEYWPMD
jgi:hypothetical protein